MNIVTFKVAPKGEGKTRWLLTIASKYKDSDRPIYLYTDDTEEYRRFCDKYFVLFNEICPVRALSAFKLTPDAIVLVDNLFKLSAQIGDINYICRNCYKMFVTIEGTTTLENDFNKEVDFHTQINNETQRGNT